MKTCAECGRDYLETYGTCPFCVRAASADDAPRPPVTRRPAGPILGIGGATLALILLGGAIWFLSVRNAMNTGVEVGNRAQCYNYQVQIERSALMYSVSHNDESVTDIAMLVPDPMYKLPVCPSGGTYSFEWDPQLPRVTCSKHGHQGDQQ